MMRQSSYVVFWLEDCLHEETDSLMVQPQSEELNSIIEVLKLTEELRTKQRAGVRISHVCFAVEDPESVGRPGVDVVGPDYDWKKRRL